MAASTVVPSPLQCLPTDILAYTLSFSTEDGNKISDLLRVLSRRSSSTDATKEEESVFRALCQLHWRSVSSSNFEAEWRPNLGSWRATYRVLQTWVPREGFYLVMEAAPWGMILRLRFEQGKFVGDLLWPLDGDEEVGSRGGGRGRDRRDAGADRFRLFRVLDVDFGDDGAIANLSLCGTDDGRLTTLLPVPEESYVHIKPIAIRHWPGMVEIRSKRALKLVMPASTLSTTEAGLQTASQMAEPTELLTVISDRDINRYRLWDPNVSTDPEEMLRSLWEHRMASEGRTLTLDWVDGPMRNETFEYLEGMPVIRPGLYSGIYVPDLYGKFKCEVVLVEYRQYEIDDSFDRAQRGNAEQDVWEDIQQEIFNSPEQEDENGFFEQVKSAVEASNSKTIVFVLGRKVTGDYHVPTQRITFGALVHPPLNSQTPSPRTVSDKGDGIEYKVVNSWEGWGTLAFPGFLSPQWARGTLVQVRNPVVTRDGDGQNIAQQFGFMWEADRNSSPETSILTRMPEQDEFPWFS